MSAASKGKLLHGQTLDQKKNITTAFTQQEMPKADADLLLGNAGVEIDPTDRGSSLVRSYTLPSSALDAYVRKVGVYLKNIDVPDRLTSVTANYSVAKGSGDYNTPEAGTFGVGSNPNYGLSLDGNAQANVSIQVDITPNILKFRPRVRAKVYFFFLTGDITFSAILLKLSALAGAAVSAWPAFDPVDVYLTVTSFEANIRVQVDVKQYVSLGDPLGLTFGKGNGASVTKGTNIRTIVIPNTIHSTVTIAEPQRMDQVEVAATVGWPEGVNWPTRYSTRSANTGNLIASISPSVIPATSVTLWPTTGLYLYDVALQEEEWGYTQIAATVIDFASL